MEITILKWNTSGNVAEMEKDSHCQPEQRTGFLLGVQQETCKSGAGSMGFNFDVPGGKGDQLITLEISCEEVACLQIPDGYSGNPARVTLRGLLTSPLWEMRCDAVNGCGPATASPLVLSFIAAGSSSHFVSLRVEDGVTWKVGSVKVSAQPLVDTLHGIAYSPYRDCQIPGEGDEPSEANIRQDMKMIQTMGNAIRTYSSTGVSAKIARIASQMGLRVTAGAWLDDDLEENEIEIEGLIDLAHSLDLESVIVGNEVMLRGDLTEEQLLGYIERVKAEVDVPVTTADISGILLQHPKLMQAVDYQLVHIYAYWDGISIENAARYVAQTLHGFEQTAGGKKVVIGETGWPSAGPIRGEAVPSFENQRRFAREFIHLAEEENIEYFYFDAFDEQWKTEGGVGPYWGLLYSDRTFKYDIQSFFVPQPNAAPQPMTETVVPVIGTQEASASLPQAGMPPFYVYTNFADESNHYAPDGWMGDIERIEMSTCFSVAEKWRETAIEAAYTPDTADENGWAGVFWLYPKDNWGTMPLSESDLPIYDLSEYTQLTFRARAETDAQVKFFLGGVTTAEDGTPLPYPSSIEQSIYAAEADAVDGFVNLTGDWQEFHIDLRGADLSHVIDGFGWAAERARNPQGIRFFVDDIAFDTNEPPAVIPPVHVYSGEWMRSDFNIGLDTSGRQRDWLTNLHGEMQASYPANQQWGVVFINFGSSVPLGQRSSIDLSPYSHLRFEMRGETGLEEVWIGIKDKYQPDDGTETRLPLFPTKKWKTYEFETWEFWGADLSQIYLPIEFVFLGSQEQTVYFRNIQYLP
jgi:exo-beta-1,3-glucanase (GH17 family)